MIVWIPATVLIVFLLLHVLADRRVARDVCSADAPESPLAEAQRILASRYAQGTVTSEEYERMLAVLRR